MKLEVRGFGRNIAIYGNAVNGIELCSQLHEVKVIVQCITNKMDELSMIASDPKGIIVVVLQPEDSFSQVCKDLDTAYPDRICSIMRESELWSEILLYAEIIDKPQVGYMDNPIFIGMNIGFVLGGVETWVAETHRYLKKNGVEAKVIETIQPELYGKYKYVGEEFYAVDEADVIKVGPFDSYVDYVIKLIELICVRPPQVYFDNGNMRTLSAFQIVKMQLNLPIKVVSFVHGDTELFYSRVCRFSNVIDKIITVSDMIRKHMIDSLPEREKDIIVQNLIPSPDNLALSNKLSDTRLHIAYVARLEIKNKRTLWLIDIAKELRRRKIPFCLHVVGEGECLKILQEFVICDQFVHEIRLYGKMDRRAIDAFYRDKHIFVNFSVSEGGPLTLYEAMAHALVPIVTNTGSAVRLISHGNNGYIANSPNEMVDYIQEFVNNKDKLHEMQRRIQETICREAHSQNELLWKLIE